MLYDPKWNDPEFEGVAMRSFIAWLETMPPDKLYDYSNPIVCATAQYLQGRGYSRIESQITFGVYPKLGDPGFWLYEIVGHSPYTFGAALDRAGQLQLRGTF